MAKRTRKQSTQEAHDVADDDSHLVRFGVAMDRDLLDTFDTVVAARGTSRSEVLRDLARAAVRRHHITCDVDAVATITLLYDHQAREIVDKLTQIQHDLGAMVHSSMHVHVDHERCLEVIVVRGRADELRVTADRMLSTRGVKHGGIEIIPLGEAGHPRRHGASHE